MKVLLKIILITHLILFACSCCSEQKEIYTVEYEILYPTGSRTFTTKTRRWPARVRMHTQGFFGNGPIIYTLYDGLYQNLAESQYPIIILNQYKNE